MARPSKITIEKIEEICLAIRSGNYIETAAALAGIHKDTLYEWLKRGNEAKSGLHKRFSDAVKEALALSEAHDLNIINRAAQPHEVIKVRQTVTRDGDIVTLEEKTTEFDWRAAAWRLERKFSDRWGPKQKTELTGKDGGSVEVTLAEIARRVMSNDDDSP